MKSDVAEKGTLTEEARAEKLMGVLVVALVFSVMNGTMFNVALPVIAERFALVPSQVSWVMTSYMVVYAVGSVVYGKLADNYSLKSLLTFGMLVFALGSIVGMAADTYATVVAARILQAAGAAVMPAASMIVPVRYFPVEKRGRALGTTAVGLALGSALGPVVAGAIAGLGSWRWLFLFSLVSLATLPLFRKYLGDDKGRPGRIDWLGGGLLGAATAAYLLAITQGKWQMIVAGSVLLLLFIVRIRKAAVPFVPPALFANGRFSAGLFIAFLAAALNFSVTFMAPQFLTSLNNLSPGGVGAVLFPAAIASALMGRIGGKLADRRGNGVLVGLASGLLLLGYGLLAGFVGEAAHWIALFLIASQIGQTFLQIAMSGTVSRTLAKEQAGVGMGMLAMLNFIAGALSMSVIGKVLDRTAAEAGGASTYSHILIAMCLTVIFIAGMYRLRFRKG
mgnify:CR=1 FL=1